MKLRYFVDLKRVEEEGWNTETITEYLNALGREGWGVVFFHLNERLTELTVIAVKQADR